MMDDAYDADRRAMSAIVGFQYIDPVERQLFGRGFWEGMHLDDMMEVGRGLYPIGEAFLDSLKNLLVEGKVFVHARDQAGRLRKIRDPDVIDFDEPLLTKQQFAAIMMRHARGSSEICSGDQFHG